MLSDTVWFSAKQHDRDPGYARDSLKARFVLIQTVSNCLYDPYVGVREMGRVQLHTIHMRIIICIIINVW